MQMIINLLNYYMMMTFVAGYIAGYIAQEKENGK